MAAEMDTTAIVPDEQQQLPPGGAADPLAANGGMTPEERELQEKEWKEELTKTEEEVNTLKQVLASKQKRVTELRKFLGIGIVSKISKDMNQGLTRLSESEVMMKANSALKSAGEKTSAAFSTVGKKLEDVKDIAKEKADGAYQAVKDEWTRKRSKSLFAIGPQAKVGGKTEPSATATADVSTTPAEEVPQ